VKRKNILREEKDAKKMKYFETKFKSYKVKYFRMEGVYHFFSLNVVLEARITPSILNKCNQGIKTLKFDQSYTIKYQYPYL
jgi:hypothetical protein